MTTVRVFLLASSLLFCAATIQPAEMIAAPGAAFAADPPQAPAAKAPDIDVRITDGDSQEVWYLDPVALAVGAGVIIVILALFAVAGRGGGTTIIREK